MMVKPKKNEEDFDLYEEKGINVYVAKNVKAENDTLTVTTEKFLKMAKIKVVGMIFD